LDRECIVCVPFHYIKSNSLKFWEVIQAEVYTGHLVLSNFLYRFISIQIMVGDKRVWTKIVFRTVKSRVIPDTNFEASSRMWTIVSLNSFWKRLWKNKLIKSKILFSGYKKANKWIKNIRFSLLRNCLICSENLHRFRSQFLIQNTEKISEPVMLMI